MRRAANAAVLLALAACMTPRPSTQIQSVWRDPQFTPGVLRHTLVIGVFPEIERRRLFEEKFAKSLRTHGRTTECSYRLLPSLDGVTRATIESLVREKKFDAVIISRMVDQKTVQTIVPAADAQVPPDPMSGAGSYFEEGAKTVTTPGYTVEQSVAVLETKLFETRQGSCLWVCRSETLMHGYLDDLIASFSSVMAKALEGP